MKSERDTVTFLVDSPIDGGEQHRHHVAVLPPLPEDPPSALPFWAAVLATGALMGGALWFYLAIRLALFSPID